MGQTLLSNQFVTGLRSDLKRKLIGTEGSLEELVLKARFEEVKTRELVGDKSRTNVPTQTKRLAGGTPSTSAPPVTTSSPPASSTQSVVPRTGARLKCYNCGLDGHMAWNCPYPKKGRRGEEGQGPSQTEPPQQLLERITRVPKWSS